MSILSDSGASAMIRDVTKIIEETKHTYSQCPDALDALNFVQSEIKKLEAMVDSGWY